MGASNVETFDDSKHEALILHDRIVPSDWKSTVDFHTTVGRRESYGTYRSAFYTQTMEELRYEPSKEGKHYQSYESNTYPPVMRKKKIQNFLTIWR